LHIEVPIVESKDFSKENSIQTAEPSSKIRERVVRARELQRKRFLEEGIFTNAEMKNEQIKKYCWLSREVKQILNQAIANFHFSARAYFKTIKIARTIADLEGAGQITLGHIAESLQYRMKLTSERY